MINSYHLDGKLLTEVIEDSAPSVGSEVCIDGVYYLVERSIRHITMCPPWRTNVHLVVSGAPETHAAQAW